VHKKTKAQQYDKNKIDIWRRRARRIALFYTFLMDKDTFLGFAKYRNAYVIFVNLLSDDNIIRSFIEVDSLQQDANILNKDGYER
jgi:hypothetical protein